MNKRMFFIVLAMMLSITASAYDAQVGGIYYNFSGTTAIVTSNGSGSYSGNVTIPSNVTYDDITYSVTSIGDWAFSQCNSLTSITIPNSVTSIGDHVFYLCSGLTSITIPNSVTSIGDQVFRDCSGLETMIVEDGNSVYDSRNNCNAIIKTEKNALMFGCKETIIPNSVTRIEDCAFSNCSSLTSIAIPNSVTRIGEYAFSGCI